MLGGESTARAAPVQGGLVLWVAKTMSTDCLYETSFVFAQPELDSGWENDHSLCILFSYTFSLLSNLNSQSPGQSSTDKLMFESEFDGDTAHITSFRNAV